MENQKVFGKVIGCETQINELINIINWFKNSEKNKMKGLDVPRGIILYGKPGNGKSLIMRELKNYLSEV